MQESPWQKNEEPQTHFRWWSSRIVLIIILAISVIVALIFFWNMMIAHTDDVDQSNIPVIKATPISKEYPEKNKMNEGDSVYSLISKEKEGRSALVVEDEAPVVETVHVEEPVEAPLPAPRKSEDIHLDEAPVASEKKEGFFLQVGSLPSRQEAEKERGRLMHKFKTILANLSVDITEKDLGKKGVFHRIQVGPFKTKDKAQSLCKNLSNQGGACFLIY